MLGRWEKAPREMQWKRVSPSLSLAPPSQRRRKMNEENERQKANRGDLSGTFSRPLECTAVTPRLRDREGRRGEGGLKGGQKVERWVDKRSLRTHHQPVVEHITCRKHEQCGLKLCFWLMYISTKFYCKSCSVTVGPDGGWGSRTFQLPSIDSDAFGLGGLLTC